MLKIKSRFVKGTLTLSICILMILLSLSFCFAVTYNSNYRLLDRLGGSKYYQLKISVTSSLYDYYRGKDHNIHSYNDLAKFVTPNAFNPIAEDLRSIYKKDEDFANGVLMIVHQIPYNESKPQKYPIETIVENEGDCDLFSFIAASIMKAGGIDVVLIYYEKISHMNVGVYLSDAPNGTRFSVYYFSYGGKRYYLAECTGESNDWINGWRVGECPDKLKGASAKIITLENCEVWSPEKVSSSLVEPASSTITLILPSKFVIQGNAVTISGSISPSFPNEEVTICVSSDSSSWGFLKKTTTDSNGNYYCTWMPEAFGIKYVKVSWSGNKDYKGSDSPVYTILIFPLHILLIGIAFIATVTILALTRHRKHSEVSYPS